MTTKELLTRQITGIGSMPQMPTSDAARWIVDHWGALPHLAEIPSRGPWSTMIGRAAALTPEIYFDLTPHGFRIVPRAGVDQRRISTLLRSDIDALQDALAGGKSVIKTQVVGPWTLAASLQNSVGKRVLDDRGACRDLTDSLAEGIAAHVEQLRSIGATEVIVQIDEPSIAAVRSASGATLFDRPRIPEDGEISEGWERVLRAVTGPTVVHSCAAHLPWHLFHGFDAVSFDATTIQDDDGVGDWLDRGGILWWGAVDAVGSRPLEPVSTTVAAVERLNRIGFVDRAGLLTLTPACGFAGASLDYAARVVTHLRDVRDGLAEVE